MSRTYLIDCETIPLPEEQLGKLMPPEIATPVMPEDIRNPGEADLSKCPAYGGSEEKQNAWKAKTAQEWKAKAEKRKTEWEERAVDAKQKFIDDAALSATTGSVKLIGLRDYKKKVSHIFIANPTPDEMNKLTDPIETYPSKVEFRAFFTEEKMLTAFTEEINRFTAESDFRLVGFYTHEFDLPFIFRRAWITGARAPYMLRKGRYWNDGITTDIHETWLLGSKQVKTGGMNALAKALGTKQKSGNGEGFHRLWNEDPVAAVLYLMDDLDVLEEAAVKMGVVHRGKETK